MKLRVLIVALCGMGAAILSAEDALPANAEQALPADKVRIYYEMRETLDPKLKGTDLFWQLQDAYGVKPTYTVREVIAVTEPKAFYKKQTYMPTPVVPARTAPVPAGAISRQAVEDFFGVLARRDQAQGKDDAGRLAALDAKYGPGHAWYRADEVREIEKNGSKAIEEMVPGDEQDLKAEPAKGWRPVLRGFHYVKVRSDWTDLLASDDKSQTDSKNPKTLDDLVGAKFGYVRDAVKRTDATSVVGAVIVPFTWRNIQEEGSHAPVIVTVAPSVTVNKVDTSGDAKTEVDYVYGRLGIYAKWLFPAGGWKGSLLGRAAYVHATDTSGHGHVNAGEIDLEPQLFKKDALELGYKTGLVDKVPVLEDLSDNTLVDLQLRAWVHGEFGDVQRNSVKWEAVPGGFFRAGPTVQAVLNFPAAWNGISLTAKYSYLRPFSGPDYHNNYMKLSSAFTIYEAKAVGQKLSFTVEYVKGSLILTKQYVETTTAGLSVVY